ncbi:MAG: SusD/RagB family nutrient-binding outer membrane lipoprotein [Sphingobacteriales bacterium]|jgi:hypothetical protein|nr:SusD/RagB family nutrient-binding outer membrane lipoprotein [Sphingobacteriales bacterium]OJW30348.1 MAG: hypothetical protein BGO54_01825 [Sphingobacteriales bacterium 46-32]
MKNKFIASILAASLLVGSIGCKKFLNINQDPANPQNPSNGSIFPAMLASIHRGVQYDARYLGKYIQYWLSTSANDNYDRHGWTGASDASGDIWRQTYYGLGKNLDYIIKQGIDKGELDYAAAGYALKAYMFQICADYHGDIIFSQAFDETRAYFDYDSQDATYRGVDSLCRLAISYADQAMSKKNNMSTSDFVYAGSMAKWKKFAYGILAVQYNNLINKPDYKPDSVIKFANLAMGSVDDDFVVPFDATKNDNTNFFGTYRNNIASFKQSNYLVKLLDGTTLGNRNGSVEGYYRDPRMKHLLVCSNDTTNGNGGFRGLDPSVGDPYNSLNAPSSYAVGSTNWINARKKVPVLWGDSLYANPSASSFSTAAGKYLFHNKAVLPVMTYAQMQFMVAEAAFRKGEKATAYQAYLNGINGHFDFINRSYSALRGNANLFTGAAISATDRANYLAGPNVKQSDAALTLTDIMGQKYIALFGWGWVETWNDLRKYSYNEVLDGDTGEPVYKNFAYPATFAVDNNNLPVQRVRPRYNSEYVWNIEALRKVGALNYDYHTYKVWFSLP